MTVREFHLATREDYLACFWRCTITTGGPLQLWVSVSHTAGTLGLTMDCVTGDAQLPVLQQMSVRESGNHLPRWVIILMGMTGP